MEDYIDIYDGNTQTIKIRLEADPDDGYVWAYIDDDEIGCFSYEVTETPYGNYQSYLVYELVSMNVTPQYRGCGIGTAMLKLGEEAFGRGHITYPKLWRSRHENHLTQEGASFLQSCAYDGIIDYDPWG